MNVLARRISARPRGHSGASAGHAWALFFGDFSGAPDRFLWKFETVPGGDDWKAGARTGVVLGTGRGPAVPLTPWPRQPSPAVCAVSARTRLRRGCRL
ncbi:hypothetical protein FAIPA1_90185 [Frankia sp. AiPs1]